VSISHADFAAFLIEFNLLVKNDTSSFSFCFINSIILTNVDFMVSATHVNHEIAIILKVSII
jgi:hypothetical protein